jgi:endoglucanase
MRPEFYVWFLTILLFTSCSFDEKELEQNNDFRTFEIKRGTNIAHWLSQSNRRGPERAAFFNRKDVAFIDSVGFDHIRLPIDEVQLWDENGERHEEAFGLLRECLRWCNDAGLRVVLDLHILRSHHFNDSAKTLWTDRSEQDKLIRLWKDLATAVGEWPTGMLAYEIMNEPVADDPEQWNDLLARVRDSIRFWEPERVLVIGSNRWQSAATFDQLEIPPDDPNIILSFHFYEPFYLTHTGASWTRLSDFEGEVNYPGQIVVNGAAGEQQKVYNIDTLEYMMRKPLHLADSLDLRLYCGEFGVIEKAPLKAKLAWYRDMVKIFEKHDIAYANWSYKAGSFGIVDANRKPDAELVRILTSSGDSTDRGK